jgi:hypothetical protein
MDGTHRSISISGTANGLDDCCCDVSRHARRRNVETLLPGMEYSSDGAEGRQRAICRLRKRWLYVFGDRYQDREVFARNVPLSGLRGKTGGFSRRIDSPELLWSPRGVLAPRDRLAALGKECDAESRSRRNGRQPACDDPARGDGE